MTQSIQENAARLSALSSYNLTYDELQQQFEDLTMLATKLAGTQISLVNLIDAYNMWTIAQQGGANMSIMDKDDAICLHTLQEEDSFEVPDLAADERFYHQDAVTKAGFRYYYGIPLKTTEGHAIGSLCVLDKSLSRLTADQKSMLKLIAKSIISRLDGLKQIELLKNTNKELENTKRIVAHDIRGPIAGIIGLAQVICEQGKDNEMDEVLSYMKLIQESGNSLLELASDILNVEAKENQPAIAPEDLFTLEKLKEKTLNLFTPRVKDKGLAFKVNINTAATQSVSFAKGKLQQIVCNLVSNAIKFTPTGGTIAVSLTLIVAEPSHLLDITIADTGQGMDQAMIDAIQTGSLSSTLGTNGEVGYGLGLGLVKQLIEEYQGQFSVKSGVGAGTSFNVKVPVSA